MKVLVTDSIAEDGLKRLREHAEVDVKLGLKPEELIAIIGDYEALAVRSQTRVTAEVISAGKKLQVIGRAGTGVDNIDIQAATQHGVIVVNAPTGNTISAAEHTIALMMALARHIPQANAALKSGAWKRSAFMGTEVRGKTLGIIGLGNVGSEVARRARGLEMKLLAYDPYISTDHASNLQVELVPLEELFRQSDFITLHTPLVPSTRGLIGERELGLVKPEARIINTARGELIDEKALVKALEEKRLAGAAIDVFPSEPTTESALFEYDNVIVTPHLGASTAEAQATAAVDIAEQIIDVFQGKPAKYAVNAPFIPVETLPILSPFMRLGATLGRLLNQLVEGQLNSIQISYEGEISNYDTNALKASVLQGIFESVSEERVNLVNANLVAAQRGLEVVEQEKAECENYSSLITIEATTSSGVTTVAGTVMRGEAHIVRVNQFWIDIVPTGGYFLFSDHRDRPGIIGAAGKITGEADINISYMYLGRLKPRGQALMILALDEPLPEEERRKILSIPDVQTAKVVKV